MPLSVITGGVGLSRFDDRCHFGNVYDLGILPQDRHSPGVPSLPPRLESIPARPVPLFVIRGLSDLVVFAINATFRYNGTVGLGLLAIVDTVGYVLDTGTLPGTSTPPES